MAISKVTPLPTAMSRSRPENYSQEGDTYFGALEQKMVPELNATVDGINTAAAVVDTQTTTTLIAAQNAAASQQAAAAAANAGPWVSGTSYGLNAVVISQVNFQAYRKRTNTSTSTVDPANDLVNWTGIGVGSMPRETRTSNNQLERGDTGKLIEITSGTFTQTFNTAPNLGNGWFVYYKNSGVGTITANGFLIYPGWFGIIHCTGSSFFTTTIRQSAGYMKVSERKASGVDGGAVGAGSVFRDLNTVESNSITNATLVTKNINLPPGTYQIRARAPSTGVRHKAFLYSLTTGTNVLIGTPSGGGNANASGASSDSVVSGEIVVTTPTSFGILHSFNLSTSTSGDLGKATGFDVEVYAEVEIWKVA